MMVIIGHEEEEVDMQQAEQKENLDGDSEVLSNDRAAVSSHIKVE